MPTAEFAGNVSWGYNPAYAFAVESNYGGPRAFRRFVKTAHRAKLGVVLDVVYNHFGPGDLGLWQFDGWSENNGGGIYFYNDWRGKTPWGRSEPARLWPGRGSAIHPRQCIYWLEEFHLDGLRFDMTLFMRTVDGAAFGPRFTRGMESDSMDQPRHQWAVPRPDHHRRSLQNDEWLTKEAGAGGAGFGAEVDAELHASDPQGRDRGRR